MKLKIIFLTNLIIFSLVFLPGIALANDGHSHESEIEEGRELVKSEVSCDKLNDEQFEAIGEYLMEQMHPGESHEAMHKMMGMEEGTEYHDQFHVNMAKTMYCGEGRMMEGMMGGGMMGGMDMTNNMMGNFGGWGWFGWIFMILIWVAIIVGIIVLIKWLLSQGQDRGKSKSASDILKERYAKGEINRKEFKEKKQDL